MLTNSHWAIATEKQWQIESKTGCKIIRGKYYIWYACNTNWWLAYDTSESLWKLRARKLSRSRVNDPNIGSHRPYLSEGFNWVTPASETSANDKILLSQNVNSSTVRWLKNKLSANTKNSGTFANLANKVKRQDYNKIKERSSGRRRAVACLSIWFSRKCGAYFYKKTKIKP